MKFNCFLVTRLWLRVNCTHSVICRKLTSCKQIKYMCMSFGSHLIFNVINQSLALCPFFLVISELLFFSFVYTGWKLTMTKKHIFYWSVTQSKEITLKQPSNSFLSGRKQGEGFGIKKRNASHELEVESVFIITVLTLRRIPSFLVQPIKLQPNSPSDRAPELTR